MFDLTHGTAACLHGLTSLIGSKRSADGLYTAGLGDAGMGRGVLREIAKRKTATLLHIHIFAVVTERSDEGKKTLMSLCPPSPAAP